MIALPLCCGVVSFVVDARNDVEKAREATNC